MYAPLVGFDPALIAPAACAAPPADAEPAGAAGLGLATAGVGAASGFTTSLNFREREEGQRGTGTAGTARAQAYAVLVGAALGLEGVAEGVAPGRQAVELPATTVICATHPSSVRTDGGRACTHVAGPGLVAVRVLERQLDRRPDREGDVVPRHRGPVVVPQVDAKRTMSTETETETEQRKEGVQDFRAGRGGGDDDEVVGPRGRVPGDVGAPALHAHAQASARREAKSYGVWMADLDERGCVDGELRTGALECDGAREERG